MKSAASERPDPQFGVALVRLNVDRPPHERSGLPHRQMVRAFGGFIERLAEERVNVSISRRQRLPSFFDEPRHTVQSRRDAPLFVSGREGYPIIQYICRTDSPRSS